MAGFMAPVSPAASVAFSVSAGASVAASVAASVSFGASVVSPASPPHAARENAIASVSKIHTAFFLMFFLLF